MVRQPMKEKKKTERKKKKTETERGVKRREIYSCVVSAGAPQSRNSLTTASPRAILQLA